MDLIDVAILALRLAIVAVLYGFLVVVLRTARSSLRVASSQASPIELRLQVLAPGASSLAAGQVIALSGDSTLGRSERADVVVVDSTVSAEHARVIRIGREWVVRDMGSTNGTLVNAARVDGQTTLHHDDVLALGGVQFNVSLLEEH